MARAKTLLLPFALVLALFATSATVGYVYSHEPSRDTLLVEFEGEPAPQPTYVIGAVAAIEGDTLRLATGAGGEREVALSPDTPVEGLERLEAALDAGASVNVGVDDTDFGQVLTGIVTIEEAR